MHHWAIVPPNPTQASGLLDNILHALRALRPGLGKLGPGRLGPGKLGPSPIWRQIGPHTFWGPICHFLPFYRSLWYKLILDLEVAEIAKYPAIFRFTIQNIFHNFTHLALLLAIFLLLLILPGFASIVIELIFQGFEFRCLWIALSPWSIDFQVNVCWYNASFL